MRRFDVYFLQKRSATGWDTLERAQSASVLVSSMVREFHGHTDAELRVVGGDWNETIGEWEFSQIFFIDRGSIDLHLAESPDSGAEDDDEPATGVGGAAGGGAFAEAIHAAREEAALEGRPGAAHEADDELAPGLTASPNRPRVHRDDEFDEDDDESTEDLRSLGFTRTDKGLDDPVGPPPSIHPEPRSRGRAFFMIGAVLISLVLIAGAALALMVYFKVEPAPTYIEMLRDWRSSMTEPAADMQTAYPVTPQTAGETERFAGVAPGLIGRWTLGSCDEAFIEFHEAGLSMKPFGSDVSDEEPVLETLEDGYTWYVRRSPERVEHFQKLGENEIQKIGDTTPDGFIQRTSDVFVRCP